MVSVVAFSKISSSPESKAIQREVGICKKCRYVLLAWCQGIWSRHFSIGNWRIQEAARPACKKQAGVCTPSEKKGGIEIDDSSNSTSLGISPNITLLILALSIVFSILYHVYRKYSLFSVTSFFSVSSSYFNTQECLRHHHWVLWN